MRFLITAALAVVVSATAATSANAFLYVGSQGSGTIGRASLDGASFNSSYVSGGNGLADVRVQGDFVYWANGGYDFSTFDPNGHGIGRATLDGTHVNQSFVDVGSGAINGIAPTTQQYIYFVGFNGTTVKRVNLDGSGAITTVVDTATATNKVAADANHVYWSNLDGTIGRSDLDGNEVDNSFITGIPGVAGLAVDADHLYWGAGSNVGRADLDGSNVEADFISGGTSVGTVAVDADHVYWANSESGRVGRADLDGNNVDQSFISGAGAHLYGIAVEPCTMMGTPGADRLLGTPGDDAICGLGGNDSILAGAGDDAVYGSGGADAVSGGPGDDLLFGGFGNDRLQGRDGNDVLNGGVEDDLLGPSAGADVDRGGPGIDLVSYGNRTAAQPVSVTLDDVANDGTTDLDNSSGSGAAHDNVAPDVERVQGGSGDDNLVAQLAGIASVLRGREGNDQLVTADGDSLDTADGGSGVNGCTTDASDVRKGC